jgi:hypothetical protein
MIAVIQCAAGKRLDAGRLTAPAGMPVEFVAHPQLAPADPSKVYARPDDVSEHGGSWREVLRRYNQQPEDNPCHLSRARVVRERRLPSVSGPSRTCECLRPLGGLGPYLCEFPDAPL